MRTRRLITRSGVLGALALTACLSTPAWAIWEGIQPIGPIMPRWTWDGIEEQERMQQLSPDEQQRLNRMSPDERAEALRTMGRSHGRMGQGEPGRRTRRSPDESSSGDVDRSDEPDSDRDTDEARPEAPGSGGQVRRGPSAEEEVDRAMREDEGPSPEMREERAEPEPAAPPARARPEAREQQGATEPGVIRREVELKPVPKEMQAPAPGQPTMPADPIDAARTHIGLARYGIAHEDWDGARTHLRQAERALDQIEARGDRDVARYLSNLKDDMHRADKAISKKAGDADARLNQLDDHLRSMKPEERRTNP